MLKSSRGAGGEGWRKYSTNAWSPRSPDLISLDLFSWGRNEREHTGQKYTEGAMGYGYS